MTDPISDVIADVVAPVSTVVERDCFIRGIEIRYDGTNRWSCTWTLQAVFAWDFGAWNSATWGDFTWAY